MMVRDKPCCLAIIGRATYIFPVIYHTRLPRVDRGAEHGPPFTSVYTAGFAERALYNLKSSTGWRDLWCNPMAHIQWCRPMV